MKRAGLELDDTFISLRDSLLMLATTTKFAKTSGKQVTEENELEASSTSLTAINEELSTRVTLRKYSIFAV